MGCSGSKDAAHDEEGKDFAALGQLNNVGTAHLPTSGPLSAKDYKSRLASSEGTQTVYFPQTGVTLRYAFVSQRGYYPGSPDKANQDSLCVHTHFGGDPDQVFMGVFDGHGEYGTQCSQFAKDKVPENLVGNTHFAVSPEIAYHRAMVLTNNQLHRLPDVDDSMSGTTAITLLIRNRTVYVANVGDSRAVLAERQGDRLIAQDLSFDQTPFRRDECERVKRCGARVLTLDQLEGLKDPNVEYWGTEEDNDGDPPRLWAPNATYPGTAFTRSIGDSAAERIGVFAEPEVVSRTLNASHPFMVLASDGVWEFLPSQSVVDMVSKFDDPQEACLSVVAESYRLWLQHETRTDDITMVVIQFQGIQEDLAQQSIPTPAGAMLDYSTRPGSLGTAMKRLPSMRMAPIESMPSTLGHAMLMPALSTRIPALGGANIDAMVAAAMNSPTRYNAASGPSSSMPAGPSASSSSSPFAQVAVDAAGEPPGEEDMDMLDRAVQHNFLFSHMNPLERRAVFAVMQKVPVQSGQLVIRQGDAGDHYYVVKTGLYDVYLQQTHLTTPELVHTYGKPSPTQQQDPAAEHAPPASFGELALLYSKARAATVVARTDGWLFSLSRDDFRAALQAVATGPRELTPLVRALRGVEVLQCLSGSQLSALATALKESTFTDGQYIIRQGEEGSDFYLVHAGEVACTVKKHLDDPNEQAREVLRLAAGQYFGERTLLGPAKRAANAVASGTCTLLHISRSEFEQIMGVPLQDIITAEGVWHDQLALQREVLTRKSAAALHVKTHLNMDELLARGLLFATDCSALMLMEHRQSEEIFTVRVTSVGDVAAAGKQALVMRARDITRLLEPSFFVPGVLNHFKDNRILAEVLMTVGLCTLDMLMADGPLDELSSVFVAASVILGLEHLHWSHIMYRGLSVHSVLVTEGGQIQLVDFRFARKDDARAYTLCGNPEYLAPEVVEQRGHTCAADLWALGVFIHCLLTGETPFALPGDDELRIYRRICRGGTPPLGDGLSEQARSLLQGLLVRDPANRLGAGPCGLASLKAHPWFAPIDWQALLEHRYPPPPGIRERIYNFEGVAYAHFEPQPYDGDIRWCDNF